MEKQFFKKIDVKGYAPLIIIALFSAAKYSLRVLRDWETAKGWEYEWIGRSIATGNGFSFPGGHRWLFPEMSPDQYFPTAWMEPIFPYFMGANFYFFGEYGKLTLLIANLFFHFMTFLVLFQVVKKISGNKAAYIAILVFFVLPGKYWVTTRYLGNSTFAGLLIAFSIIVVLWFLKDSTWKKAIPTGLYFGVMTLTHAGTLLFAPVLSLYIFISSDNKRQVFFPAVIVSLLTVAAISPWTLRNYLVFEEFLPVRNSIGQILYVSNTALGDTLQDQSVESSVQAPWKSDNLWHAWVQLKDNKKRQELERYAERKIAAEKGEVYLNANEVGRDKQLLAEAKHYMLQNFGNTILLSAIKAIHFFFLNWSQSVWKIPLGPVVTLLAVIGALLFCKRRIVAITALFVISYAAPYMATAPYFYRYRYPVEPLIIILSSLMLAWMAEKLYSGKQPRSDNP